jgi:hypothetical protein
VRELARDAGLVGLDQNETAGQIPLNDLKQGRMLSHWVVLARRLPDLARLSDRPGWRPLAGPSAAAAVWTDDYSDLVGLLRW